MLASVGYGLVNTAENNAPKRVYDRCQTPAVWTLDWYNQLPLHTTTLPLLCGVVVGYTSPDRRRLTS